MGAFEDWLLEPKSIAAFNRRLKALKDCIEKEEERRKRKAIKIDLLRSVIKGYAKSFNIFNTIEQNILKSIEKWIAEGSSWTIIAIAEN